MKLTVIAKIIFPWNDIELNCGINRALVLSNILNKTQEIHKIYLDYLVKPSDLGLWFRKKTNIADYPFLKLKAKNCMKLVGSFMERIKGFSL